MTPTTTNPTAQEGPLAVIERPIVTYDGTALLARARLLTFETDLDLEVANQVKKECNAGIKILENLFEPTVKAADAAHHNALALREIPAGPLRKAVAWIQGKMDEARQRQREAAALRQLDLERLARKDAEDRQLAETIRLEEEAKAKRAEAERLAAEGKTSEAEIASAEAEQTEGAARELIQAPPEPIYVPVVALGVIAGMSDVDNWVAEVTDEGAFYRALGERPELWRFAPIDHKELARMAKKDKAERSIPGITVKNVPKTRSR